MMWRIMQIEEEAISLEFKVSWKLYLYACFQPDGVFRFENRISVYYDTAIS